MSKGKKKRKLRIRGVIFLFLLLYLIAMFVYYLFTVPVKRVVVENIDLINENMIIETANIDDKTPLFKINTISLIKKLKKLELVHDVKVKKSITGKITIIVQENKILFLNENSNKLVLSDETEINQTNQYYGYPLLINYVPSEIYKEFIKGLAKIDTDIITMISEIEYSPDRYEDIIIDEERFLLRMNDGNKVYVNIANIEKLNKYQTIYAKVGESNGILYLDSASKNYIFNTNEEALNED